MSEEGSNEAGQPQAYKEWRERERNFLEYLEDITRNPLREQENILAHILRKNADTDYLQDYELDGASDVETFKKLLPISDYDSYKPYVDRIFEGDTSPVLSADPVVEILTSSGTSGGEPKLFPITEEDLDMRSLVWSLMRPVLNRALPGLEKGKALFFYFVRAPGVSPAGLSCQPAVTSFVKSSGFKRRPFDPSYRLTSPDEVIETIDNDAAMYCHLLLGLLQREEVLRFGAIFAPVILKALRSLEDMCPELCEDIANGTLSSSRVKDEVVRSAVLPMLRKDPELAEFVRSEVSPGKSSDGILRRLWPNVKVVDTVCTGSMEAYLRALADCSGHLPVICTQLYAATEGYFGVNLNPMCPPEEIYYTLFPSAAYYEFRAVSGGSRHISGPDPGQILDLVSLKEGQEYEILVTTVSGLYRYRMGDILKVVGFYNSAPTFQFMRRMNIVLSVDTDKTDEKDLHTAVCRGTELLEKDLGLRLVDYTSAVDHSSNPGHYVIFWELVPSSHVTSRQVLEKCCLAMEAALGHIYRRGRHEKVIGALELRLVQEGTFDLLASHAIARGATLSQYKTPRGLNPKNGALLELLSSRVSQTFFSKEKPPYAPGALRVSPSGRHTMRDSPSGRRVILESTSGKIKVFDPKTPSLRDLSLPAH